MSLLTVLRKVWNDSVWSKVIAAGITAGLAAIGSLAFAQGATLGDLWAVLTQRVVLPLWLLVVLGLAFVALAFRRRRGSGTDEEAQPNAVPIAWTDTPVLERPFEGLSSQQQRLLARQFRRGSRVFRTTPELEHAGWFEELAKWHYIAPHETGASESSRYEITLAGWRELERVRSEAAGLPTR